MSIKMKSLYINTFCVVIHTVGRPSARRLMLTPEALLDSMVGGGGAEEEEEESQHEAPPEDVLVISLGVVNDCPGMLSEQKVCSVHSHKLKLLTLLLY